MTGGQVRSRAQSLRRTVVPRAKWAAVLLAASLCVPAIVRPAVAQVDTATVPAPYRIAPAIKWGKWAAAAFAVGATALAIHQHSAGNNAYADLVQYCGVVATCSIGPDGRYVDGQAEATYQHVVRDDRSARAWLVVGQLAALGSAVLFVLELRHQAEPPNIPFNGLLVETGGGIVRVGYRMPFRF